jgi:hypothetical protein
MRKSGWRLGAISLLLAAMSSSSVIAAPGGGEFSLACANGHNYTLRARAVSPAGELVTGYLYTSPRRASHVRLIPMGNGYRYAGRGIWLDGIREVAVLNFGKRHAVACTVQSVAGPAVVSALN